MTMYSERDEEDHQYRRDIKGLNKNVRVFFETLFFFAMGVFSLYWGLNIIEPILSAKEMLQAASIVMQILFTICIIFLLKRLIHELKNG